MIIEKLMITIKFVFRILTVEVLYVNRQSYFHIHKDELDDRYY